MLVVLILFGRWLERRARSRSGQALRRLLELGADEARVLRDGAETPVPVAAVAVGDNFVVAPGELATDGVVERGRSSVDRSLLTGESAPRRGRPRRRGHRGHRRPGGVGWWCGRPGSGRLCALARIARLVEDRPGLKAPVQRLADQVAGVFVPVVLAVAALTLAGWLLTGHSAAEPGQRRRGRADRGLPMLAGAGHPDPQSGSAPVLGAQLGVLIRGAEDLEPGRSGDHRPARQDGHPHRGPHGPGRGGRGRRRRPGRAAGPGGQPGGRLRHPVEPGRGRGPGAAGCPHPVEAFADCPGGA